MDQVRAVTTSEAARRLPLRQRTVQRLIRKDERRAVRVGRMWRVPMAALSAFLEAGRPRENAEVTK